MSGAMPKRKCGGLGNFLQVRIEYLVGTDQAGSWKVTKWLQSLHRTCREASRRVSKLQQHRGQGSCSWAKIGKGQGTSSHWCYQNQCRCSCETKHEYHWHRSGDSGWSRVCSGSIYEDCTWKSLPSIRRMPCCERRCSLWNGLWVPKLDNIDRFR